jgi:hypothetical protein
VQDEASVIDVRILIKVIDTISIQERAAALYAVNCVTFIKKQLSQISTVLASNSRNQGSFCHKYGDRSLGILKRSSRLASVVFFRRMLDLAFDE